MSSIPPQSPPLPDPQPPSPAPSSPPQPPPEAPAPPPKTASPDIMGEPCQPQPPPLSARLAQLTKELEMLTSEAVKRGVMAATPPPEEPAAMAAGEHDGLLEFTVRLVGKRTEIFGHTVSVSLSRLLHPSQLHIAPTTVQAMVSTTLLQPLNTALLDHVETLKVTADYRENRLELPPSHSDDI